MREDHSASCRMKSNGRDNQLKAMNEEDSSIGEEGYIKAAE